MRPDCRDAQARRGARPASTLAAWTLLASLGLTAGPRAARAQSPDDGAADAAPPTRRPVRLDRVAVRWFARTTGGVDQPQFISARQLAFEARIEAMTEGPGPEQHFTDKHVRAAIRRHITETLLARLPVDPAPTPKQVARYAESARLIIEQQVGGRSRLNRAAATEGVVSDELNAMLRRRARASWYLDKMVAPMLRPSDVDLREVHQRGDSPFRGQPYDRIAAPLRRWYISKQMGAALDRYYRNAKARVTVRWIER